MYSENHIVLVKVVIEKMKRKYFFKKKKISLPFRIMDHIVHLFHTDVSVPSGVFFVCVPIIQRKPLLNYKN